MVLGPVVLRVDDPGRGGLGPPVLERQDALLERGDEIGSELVAEIQQSEQVVVDGEVARVADLA